MLRFPLPFVFLFGCLPPDGLNDPSGDDFGPAGADSDTLDTDTNGGTESGETDSGADDSGGADSGADDSNPAGDIEIAGTWIDGSGATYLVGSASWTITPTTGSASRFSVSDYDNDLDYAVAQNDPTNPVAGGAWSRFDWAEAAGVLYLCHVSSDAASEADAAGVSADRADVATSGCDGAAWTRLDPDP